MRLNLKIENLGPVREAFEQMAGPRAKAVYAKALNDVGFQIRRDWQREIGSAFDRPTQWVLGSPWVVQATPDQLNVAVLPTRRRDAAGGTGGKTGVDPQLILQAQEFGGTRRDKKSEVLLRRAGILPAGYQTAIPATPFPGSDDGRGNLRGPFVQQLLSYLQTFGEQGYRANMTARRRASVHRGTKRQDGRRYFVSYGRLRGNRSSHLAPGIWAASGTHGVLVRPVLMFVRAPHYQPRISAERVAAMTDRAEYFERRMRYRIRQELGI